MPLAPGYKIQKEVLSVHFAPGSPPHLAVRADYRLSNVGNAPLHYIAVEFPGARSFGRANMRAEIDGNEINPQHNPHESADDWRIPLSTPWQQKKTIHLVLSYDLATETPADSRILVAANTFYLNDSDWFPMLMGFKAFLSPSISRPNPTDLTVTVPADFRVTASGEVSGVKNQNGEVEHRFRLRKGDFDPYVFAGQYTEQRISSANAVYWFDEPPSHLQQSSETLAQTLQFYEHLLGPLPRDNATIHVVAPRSLRPAEEANRLESPPTVVFASESAATAPLGKEFPSLADKQSLAGTWFFHVVIPRPEAWLLADGLSSYVAELDDQRQADSVSRTAEISSTIANFDSAVKEATEKPIISVSPADSIAQRRIAAAKIVLALFALEDKCGPQNVTHAVADMVYALRGQEYGYSDFRAALEQRSHQDLAIFFRTWLTKPGIPVDFRARYENAAAGNR